MSHVLVTGGAGYIGSHTVVELLQAGHGVTILDNLSNSSPTVIDRLEKLTGRRPKLVVGDICDADDLRTAFGTRSIDAVIHFAGLKAVGESVANPRSYYRNNMAGSIALLDAMDEHDVRSLVFSSSATVYGDPDSVPLREGDRTGATNPYGRTKHMIEQMLADLVTADDRWRIACLRYFNPVGAHPSGTIGEDPRGVPNNLLPFIAQVAVGRRDRLAVFGNDYPTPDGTGVRDYIHVVDLAVGHLRALDYLSGHDGMLVANLGTGRGHSVLEVVHAFEAASGTRIPYDIVDRRPGDVAQCYADPTTASDLLSWQATRTLDDMCADTWRWQSANPDGYDAP